MEKVVDKASQIKKLVCMVAKLKLIDANRIAKDIVYGKQKLFECANKPDKQLTNLLSPKRV